MVKGDPTLSTRIKQFVVAGRKLPTEADPHPTIYRMRLFATDEVVAKSRFWYFCKRMNRIKKTHGEIVSVNEVHEKKSNIAKTYGLLIRYDSRSGTHNMYREYRDTSICGAVARMYQDMAGRHRARPETIFIVNVSIVRTADQIKRPYSYQFYNSNIKFPLFNVQPRASSKAFKHKFAVKRPSTTSF